MKHWTHLLMKTGMSLEKENMIWNMTGSFFYAFASMVLSFLVLRIAGEEQGGIFSFGFSTLGQQMFIVAYFGIRPFQITDGTGEYSFGDYPDTGRLFFSIDASFSGAGLFQARFSFFVVPEYVDCDFLARVHGYF